MNDLWIIVFFRKPIGQHSPTTIALGKEGRQKLVDELREGFGNVPFLTINVSENDREMRKVRILNWLTRYFSDTCKNSVSDIEMFMESKKENIEICAEHLDIFIDKFLEKRNIKI